MSCRRRLDPVLLLALLLLSWARDAAADEVRAAAAGEAPRVAAAAPITTAWQWLGESSGRGEETRILAVGREGELAIGDSGGMTWWRGGRRERAALPPVRDALFDEAGQLVVATEAGLYVWSRNGRPLRRTLRDGQAGNTIHRLARAGTAWVLATDAGAYWSPNGRIEQPLRAAGASRPITLVAVVSTGAADAPPDASLDRGGSSLAEVWLFGAGLLARVRGVPSDAGLRVVDVQREDLPDAIGDRAPVDLVFDAGSDRLHLVFDDVVVSRSVTANADRATTAWRIRRPVLPPGARIRRLATLDDGVLLATDHGLLAAPALDGPFQRVGGSAGTSDCVDVRADRLRTAVVLCREGVFAPMRSAARGLAGPGALLRAERARVAPDTPGPGAGRDESGDASRFALAPDPPVELVLRHALRRSGLDVERDRRLRRGLWQRAFWPKLSLQLGADFDHDRARDADQSFVSGDTRYLLDRSRDEGRRLSASVSLDWDLGGVAFPDDAVDLSREQRQVVSLRDDVADEINQLYFERQAIRERLATPGAIPDPAEVARLRWRAREIEAGLDAWTGGFVARWRFERSRSLPGAPAAADTLHPEVPSQRNETR
ncbi:MAG: hypothetical protein R3F16_13275 [Myxococcota bacterium]